MMIGSPLEEVSRISEARSQLREAISLYYFCFHLRENQGAMNVINSALDIIDDTLEGMHWFFQDGKEDDNGAIYVSSIGLLQAIYIQLDASRQICKCLGINLTDQAQYDKIASLRNCAAGHPVLTDRENNDHKDASHFWDRSSLSWEGFTLFSTSYRSGRAKNVRRSIIFSELMRDHAALVIGRLNKALDHLKQKEVAFRNESKNLGLKDEMRSWDWLVRKIVEQADGKYNHKDSHCRMIATMIERVDAMLERIPGEGIRNETKSDIIAVMELIKNLPAIYLSNEEELQLRSYVAFLNTEINDIYKYIDSLEARLAEPVIGA